jgi:hypothetical protein
MCDIVIVGSQEKKQLGERKGRSMRLTPFRLLVGSAGPM